MGPAENHLVEEDILSLIYVEMVLPNELRPAKNSAIITPQPN